jgi:hypothetical protein
MCARSGKLRLRRWRRRWEMRRRLKLMGYGW